MSDLKGEKMKVRVRFAPSPTGYLHIGGLRTALYSYLFAKVNDGDYILRIEDTDRTRLVEDATKKLVDTLNYIGIKHDEGPEYDSNGVLYQVGDRGPYIQSKNLANYSKYADKLIESGHAYRCFCSKERLDHIREDMKKEGLTPRYDGLCRNLSEEESKSRMENGEPYVVRLKLPENKDITFHDYIRGDVTFNTEDLDDQVLIKQDGFPTYHLAVVVDDNHMGITHVIRGEEWVSSTPKHIALYEAFGWDKPKYIHLPLILNESKKKLSKRHDDVSVESFLEKGYLKEALINYVSLLGWSPEDDVEIMSLDDLIAKFNFEKLSHSSAVFSVDKLKWVNAQHIRNMDIEELMVRAIPFMIKAGTITDQDVTESRELVEKMVLALQERVEVLSEFGEKAKVFVDEDVVMEDESCLELLAGEHAKPVIETFLREIKALDSITDDNAKAPFKVVQKETGYKGKKLFMTIRVALSGQMHGVDMNDLLVILGKDKVISRLEKALNS